MKLTAAIRTLEKEKAFLEYLLKIHPEDSQVEHRKKRIEEHKEAIRILKGESGMLIGG